MKNLLIESHRRAVCAYYEWPLVGVAAEFGTDSGKIRAELQLWALPEALYGRRFSATESGARIVFISSSVQDPDFRRTMTVYLEPVGIILSKENNEAVEMKKVDSGNGLFAEGTAVIYDHGNQQYAVYLYPENGRSAVKIEASLTEEELVDLLKNCRVIETAG